MNDSIETDKSRTVTTGDRLDVEVPPIEEPEDGIVAEDKPIDVVHEDEELIVLNKSSGIVVHPTEDRPTGTLANRLVAHYPELASVGPEHRAGLAHRLDRGTSGVLLVARTNEALEHLQDQFRARTVEKTYRVLLSGELEDERLRIEVPIGYNPHNRTLRKATPEGQYAESVFEREAVAGNRTSAWCHPKTGRTHQIRVHAQYVGMPVVGDEKYGGDSADRLMLHAETITLEHPRSNETVTYTVEPEQEVLEPWNTVVSSS